ncbi:hypothetical protein RGCCGE502_30368 (plasmid) [Rhizobium grahamii CCGE 502]|uniref:Uncharacterized protein n=1 Tax=Rhizobium grahamii CCGE 502 TaxID=990285 RepID=S3H8E5_9HYPH|nr:hypothetical protein RGCCGE502_30368 [Rhizobium grahamii CCGE 502]
MHDGRDFARFFVRAAQGCLPILPDPRGSFSRAGRHPERGRQASDRANLPADEIRPYFGYIRAFLAQAMLGGAGARCCGSRQRVETGSYRQSIIAVAEGAADVAAIDCKTFADGYGLSQVRWQPSPQRGQSQEKKGRRKTAAHKV